MSGERSGFIANSFHKVAITANTIRVMVNESMTGAIEARGEPGLGHRQTNRISESLAERAGGHFDTRSMTAFRMPGGLASELSKALEFGKGQIISRQVEQTV